MSSPDGPGREQAGSTDASASWRDWPRRDLVAHRADATPDREAVVDAQTGDSWTYRELDAWVEAVADLLRDREALAGRIGVLSRPRPAFVALLHAAWRSGRELVPLSPELPPTALAAQVERADVGVLLAEADSRELADAAVESDPVAESNVAVEAPSLSPFVSGGDTDSPFASGGDTDDHRTDPAASPSFVPVTLFTSGSTGDPKAVRLTVRNLISSATASAFRLGVTRDDRWLSPLPVYHMGGVAPIVRCAFYGATVVLQREFDADATASALDAHDATGISLVPTAMSRLLETGWRPGEALRFVLLGGAAADPELLGRCEEADVPVHPSYGMTETASQIATATPAQAFADSETVGQPLVNATVTVVDERGNALPRDERGELVVAGPTVTPGYLHGDGDAFSENGFHTGDRGYRDDDGKVYVTGRIDEMIVTGGENVQPARVERVLAAQPGVADAAVVGLPDPEWGERVAALVVPADDDALDATSVRSAVREDLAGHEVPKTVAIADAIPRTASGTVDREAVRERLREASTED